MMESQSISLCLSSKYCEVVRLICFIVFSLNSKALEIITILLADPNIVFFVSLLFVLFFSILHPVQYHNIYDFFFCPSQILIQDITENFDWC